MLVLERRIRESIMIGDADTVCVQITPDDGALMKQWCEDEVPDEDWYPIIRKIMAAHASRKPIVVTVCDIRDGSRIHIGVDAPRAVAIDRAEVAAARLAGV